jgi:hypothetical protein
VSFRLVKHGLTKRVKRSILNMLQACLGISVTRILRTTNQSDSISSAVSSEAMYLNSPFLHHTTCESLADGTSSGSLANLPRLKLLVNPKLNVSSFADSAYKSAINAIVPNFRVERMISFTLSLAIALQSNLHIRRVCCHSDGPLYSLTPCLGVSKTGGIDAFIHSIRPD